jgi:hypothetical protein
MQLASLFFRRQQLISVPLIWDIINIPGTIMSRGKDKSESNLQHAYNTGSKSDVIPVNIAQVGAPQGSEQRSRPPRDAEPRGTGCVRPRGLRLLGILRPLGENTWATPFYWENFFPQPMRLKPANNPPPWADVTALFVNRSDHNPKASRMIVGISATNAALRPEML